MDLPLSALHRQFRGRFTGPGGIGHAYRHGTTSTTTDRTTAFGTVALLSRMRGFAHFADGETGTPSAGYMGSLLETDAGYYAAYLLSQNAGAAHRLPHHVRLLPVLRRQSRRTAGSARLQGP